VVPLFLVKVPNGVVMVLVIIVVPLGCAGRYARQ
jgi:hypothetical protein